MNPQFDKAIVTTLPDGQTIRLIQPAERTREASRDWRLSQVAVDRYKPYLEQMASAWPREISFEVPNGISPNTFVHRLRDARAALIHFKYYPDLALAHENIGRTACVAFDKSDGKVWFRERSIGGNRHGDKYTPRSEVRNPALSPAIQDLCTAEQLEAFCKLLTAHCLTGPILFKGRFDADLISRLEAAYDIALVFDERTSLTTLI